MQKYLDNYLKTIFIRRLKKAETFKKDPSFFQAKVFFRLIKKAQKTEFGKKYNFSKIIKEKDFGKAYYLFSQQVPVFSYDDFKDWIIKARRGKRNIIWPGKIKMYAKSSGTTSDKSKFIPVTKDFLKYCHLAAGQYAFATYIKNNPNTKLFTGKVLGLSGSMQEDELNSKNVCGDLSALTINGLPAWAQAFFRAPKKEIALMKDWEDKLEKITIDTKNKDIVALAGVPSWVLILLKKVEEITGKKIQNLWPNLELFLYGGVAIGPYQEQFKKICGEKTVYVETYSSSEGLFGVGDEPSLNDMLLMLNYDVFYEFIPLEDLDKKNPQVYNINEVELERNYALVISTSGGLWRYLVGDTIKFTNLNPYRFIISGRTKSFINVFGEELMVHNAEQALVKTCSLTDSFVQEYSVAPVFTTETNRGKHEWLIEFTKEPANLEEFANILDKELQKVNSDYENKRYKDISLKRLKLVKARPNLFHDWLLAKNKLGGQHKVPRLANDRELMEEMLKLNQ